MSRERWMRGSAPVVETETMKNLPAGRERASPSAGVLSRSALRTVAVAFTFTTAPPAAKVRSDSAGARMTVAEA